MIRNRTKIAVFSMLGVGFLSGCGRDSGVSELQHDNNQPVRNAAAWNWSAVSEADEENVVLAGSAPGGFVSSNSNLVKRSQYWVDKIDSSLRAARGAEMAGVPKPRVKLIKEAQFNAFIANTYSCFNLPIEVSGRQGAIDAGLYIDLAAGGELSRWNDTDAGFPVQCINDTDTATLVGALNEFNATSRSCKLSVANGKVVASAGCPLGSDMADRGGIAGGRKIVISRTSSWVNIFTGLVEQLPNEEQFVSVIAHELGHYYRSHITAKRTDYGFYYSLGDRNPSRRPEARADLQQFGDEVYHSAEIINTDSSFAQIAGQQISAKVYLAAGDIARQVCAAGTCSVSCRAVADLVSDSAYRRNNKIYPFGAGPISADIYASKFEAKAKTCLADLAYGTRATVTPAMVHAAIGQPVWFGAGDAQNYYPANVKSLIRDILTSLAKRSSDLPTAANALDVLLTLGQKLDEQLPHALVLMTQARDQKLGQYTEEQEADELAVEWTTAAGLPPASMVHTNMTIAGLSLADEMNGLSLGGTSCKALFDNNWEDAAGNSIFVPIGDYSEVHHSPCFRAFNTQRELLAHGYEQRPGDGSVAPGGAWDGIKAEAVRVNQRARRLARAQNSRGITAVPSFVRKDQARLDSCVFSQNHGN